MNNDAELLFNTKFVHIVWSDKLKEKDCFCANDIYTLRKNVIDGDFHKWLIKPFDYRYGVRVIEKGLKNYIYVNNTLKTYDDVDCGLF